MTLCMMLNLIVITQLYSVDQLLYMPIDDIYDSNKQHQPGSRIETEKERQGKNEHDVVPEPKTNLNRTFIIHP